jgi:hypothetical protein
VHLEGLDQEILGIPAIRTRKRQNGHSRSGPARPGRQRVYRI